jgi:hypothetical protein
MLNYKIVNGIAVTIQEDINGFDGLWAEESEGFTIGDLYDEDNGWSHLVKTSDELEAEGREWRDNELKFTDSIVAITDHSSHTALMSYRQELRDWTDTSDFPATKPTKP